MQRLFDGLMIVLFYVFRIIRVKKNKIVISSYLGKGYGDNSKYIVEELIRRGNNYDIVWLTKNMSNEFPQKVRKVNYRSVKAIYELATAKIWIDNRRKPPYVRKREGQFYIMTWHGYMAIKKLEKDAEHSLEKRYIKMAKRDSKMIDCFVSGSDWETRCIRSAFWYDGKIAKVGYPRSDVLISNKKAIYQFIRQQYKMSGEDKILLYAPTFRKSKDETSLNVYNLEWRKVLGALKNRFGGNWVGMIRLHPNVAFLTDKLNIPNEVINVTDYDDMQELIVACDCMITDYSSSIMDAGVAEKIGLIFALDYDEYEKDRDVYFNIKNDMPFLFSDSTDMLIKNIESFNISKYYRELHQFKNEKYGIYNNGNASAKICDIIDRELKN